MNQSAFSYLFSEELYHPPGGVVVVLARQWDDYSADDKTLLTRILGSVKLHPAGVRMICQSPLSLASLKAYAPSHVLIFGSETEGISNYEASQAQGFSVLKADDLTQLDDARKKSLWMALKGMFGL